MDTAHYARHLAHCGVSETRRRDCLRLLREFDAWLADRSLLDADGEDLGGFLAHRRAVGYAANTLRKERQMARSYFAWAFEEGRVSAEALLSIRGVEPPLGASRRTKPQPYTRKELRSLNDLLDSRWPKLDTKRASRSVARWRKGIAPYRHIRRHAIRLQLEAVISLAIHCGMRRGEIADLHIDDVTDDNAYVVVWQGERWGSPHRKIPFTGAGRACIGRWLDFRAAMQPRHEQPWLNLWASTTARSPMARATFDKLLANYLGREWSFRRLRHTAGVNWLRAGLAIWELQRLLGHRALKDTLPYGEAIKVPLEQRVERLDKALTRRLPLAA